MAPAAALIEITRRLRARVDALGFGPPVHTVYNPLGYARAPFEQYLRHYAKPGIEVLLLGMNPGPWGMAQTGVPFGDVQMVRDWVGIERPVGKPSAEHPKRPVLGFACQRGEVSGQRLWGWARDAFGTADQFFARFFVYNYCPLCFMEESGRNLTPDKLRAAERAPLEAACDEALAAVAEALRPAHAVGVGKFAGRRIKAVLQGQGIALGDIPHPSPASPKANRGWAPLANQALAELGIALPKH